MINHFAAWLFAVVLAADIPQAAQFSAKIASTQVTKQADQPPAASHRRLPAEFERQSVLLLSCGDLTGGYADTIAHLVASMRSRVQVIVLYRDVKQQQVLLEALRGRLDSSQGWSLLQVPHDSKWIRDYGPTLIRAEMGYRIIDWRYEQGRPLDDEVPQVLARLSQTNLEPAAMVLSGGNLLSNGSGLCLTTTAVFRDNLHLGITKADLQKQLAARIGATQLVLLEPLLDEPTGHLDMFVTFVGAATVVVGSYRVDEDPENAAILDRNAKRLSSVQVAGRPLQVVRIPMGQKHDGVWRTYTNCVYANGLLVVPRYQSHDGERLARALAVYRRLLPGWDLATIDATEMIIEGGSLHCATLNLPGLTRPLASVLNPFPFSGDPHQLIEVFAR